MTDGPAPGAVDVSGDSPPPEKRRRGRGKKALIWVGGIVAVLLVGFGVLVAVAANDTKNELDETAALQAGQCISVTGMNTSDPTVVPADCAVANYRIGVRLPGTNASCPAGDYDTYQQGSRFGGDVTFCMVPNFVQGKCYLLNDAATAAAPCKGKAGEGHIKIDQVLTGTTKKNDCAETSNLVLTYSQPATVFCARTL